MTFKTFDQIVKAELVKLEQADIDTLQSIERESMIEFHSTVGMDIRNNYDLWNIDNPLTAQWAKDQGDTRYLVEGIDHHPNHPDAVSMNILLAIWDTVNGERTVK